MMKVEYDKSSDSAYIYLCEIGPGEVSSTYPCNPLEVHGMINLDFDKDGLLIGIEVIDASKKLPPSILESASIISQQ